MPYHTLTNGACVYTAGEQFVARIDCGPSSSDEEWLNITAGTIPLVYTSGRQGFGLLAIMSNFVPGVFIKDITVHYTLPPATDVRTAVLPNSRDIYIDNIDAMEGIQTAEVFDPTWLIKRITIRISNETAEEFERPAVGIGFLGALDPATQLPGFEKVRYFIFEKIGKNRVIGIDVV
jgi:hypothetical protein